MHAVVEQMLSHYRCESIGDYEQALKEIIQEIALLGLWRAKFFEIAAFYGGTALRILHGLPRFSEDMDFSLLKGNPNFNIASYEGALIRELTAFDFEVQVTRKVKTQNSPIASAFIKANTLIHLIKVRAHLTTHKDSLLKVKIEVDTDPPGNYTLEVRSHFNPVPFSVKTFDLPTLFAGKIAACLFRPYVKNTKGRDWYDFLWYISQKTSPNIRHLQARIVQLQKWDNSADLTIADVQSLLVEKIKLLDISQAKADVLPFVGDKEVVKAWTKELFFAAITGIIY